MAKKLLGGGGLAALVALTIWLLFREKPSKTLTLPSEPTPSSEHAARPPHEKPSHEEGLRIRVLDRAGAVIRGASVSVAGVVQQPKESVQQIIFVEDVAESSPGLFVLPSGLLNVCQHHLTVSETTSAASIILFIRADGYVPAREDISASLQPGEREVVLLRKPVIIGKVIDAWEETPLEKIPVLGRLTVKYLYPDPEKAIQSPTIATVSSQDGSFRLETAEAGEVEITSDPDEFLTVAAPKVVAKAGGEIRGVILRVKGGLTTVLKGRVLDRDGKPVSGAEVYMSTQFGYQLSRPVTSNEEGEYLLMVPPDRDYSSYHWFWAESGGRESVSKDRDWKPHEKAIERLVAEAEGHFPGLLEVARLGRGEVREGLDIVLGAQEACLSGTVWKQTGGPASNGRVYAAEVLSCVFKEGERKLLEGVWRCAEDGSYVARVPEGEYMFVAWNGDKLPPVRHGNLYSFGGTDGPEVKRVSSFDIDPSGSLPRSDFRASWLPDIARKGQEIAPGVRVLEYKYADFQTKLIKVLAGSSASGVDFIVPDVGYIRGIVVDESGAAWPFGSVRVSDRQAVIQDDGTFEITDLAAGTRYTLEVVPNEGTCKELEDRFVLLDLREKREVEAPAEGIILAVGTIRAGELHLKVTGKGNAPVTQYLACLSPLRVLQSRMALDENAAYGQKSARVNSEDGTCTFEKLFPGEYRLELSIYPEPGEGQIAEHIEIPEGESVSLHLSIEGRWASVSGQVLDSKGSPVPECWVTIHRNWLELTPDVISFTMFAAGVPSLGSPLMTETSDTGEFSFRRVPVGDWLLCVQPKSTCLRLKVPLEVRTDVDGLKIEIPGATGQIFGAITDEGGKPWPALVSLTGERFCGYTQAKDAGRYDFTGLPSGKYKLSFGDLGFWESRDVVLPEGGSVEVNLQEARTTRTLIAELDLSKFVGPEASADELFSYPTLFLEDLENPGNELILPLGHFRGSAARRERSVPGGLYSARVLLRLSPPGRPDNPWPRPDHPDDVTEVRSKPAVIDLREDSKAVIRLNQFE